MTETAALLGAFGASLALLARTRLLLTAGLLLLGAAEAMLAWQLRPDSFSPGIAVAAGLTAAGLIAVALLATGFVLRPAAVPVVLLLAAPFRVSVDVGHESAFLLVPLYGVLAAAGLSYILRMLRGWEPPSVPPIVAVPVAAFVALAGLSVLWSDDLVGPAIELGFFLLPFAALVALVARSELRSWTAPALGTVLVALGCVFALVGLWQVRSGDLFFAHDVEVANLYTNYTRVTSLFNDASIYGRHLVLALLVVVVALWFGRIAVLAGAAVAALLWAGLYFSYSQSSMVALCAGLLTATLVAATPRVRLIVLAVGAASVLLAGSLAIASGHRDSLTRFTSGRSELVRDTLNEIRDHPVLGVGIGNEARVGAPARRQRDFVRTPSHTTPLTVTAELGIAGVLAYLAFLSCSALLVVRVYRRDPVVGLTLGTLLVALVVHSLFYSGFFEDPLTWGILALGAATLTAPAFARGTAPAAAPAAEAGTT